MDEPCLYCGRTPTAEVRFQGYHGLPDTEWPNAVIGPLCHDCGIAVFRRTTEWQLSNNWLSVFMMPITVLENMSARRQVAKLDPPTHPITHVAPLDPGRPMLQRGRAAKGLLPVVVLLVLVAGIATTILGHKDNRMDVGSCVQVTKPQSATMGQVHFATAQARLVSCNDTHNGVLVATDSSNNCPDGDGYISDDQHNDYCIRPS